MFVDVCVQVRPCQLSDKFPEDGNGHNHPLSYEELCRAHVDSYMAAASAAEVQQSKRRL
jgi:hypothetical protein